MRRSVVEGLATFDDELVEEELVYDGYVDGELVDCELADEELVDDGLVDFFILLQSKSIHRSK